MVCQSCGNVVSAEVRFCPKCGAQVVAPAPVAPPPHPSQYPPVPRPLYAMPPPRVQRNLQTLGILWCVFGAYRVLAGLMGVFALRMMSMRGFGGNHWMWGGHFHGPFGSLWMGVMPFVAVISIAAAALAFLVGYSLLARRPWGRVFGIVIAVLSLLKFPIGTALGIYTLWVLAPATSGAEYDAIADHR
ncbi:MAG: zinc-ribbon domain-containing protein [Edaphobacter sp.]